MKGGLISVEVEVGEDGTPRRFILDSGAEESMLSSRVAEEIGLPTIRREQVLGVDGLRVAHRTGVVSLALGGRKLFSRSLLTLDLKAESRALGTRIDGLLGADVFHGRVIRINFKTLRVDFSASPESAPGATVLGMSRNHGAMCVSIDAQGATLPKVRIDTGCFETLCWSPPENSGVTRPWRRVKSQGVDLGLGTLALGDVPTKVHREALFPGENGLLGIGLMSGFDSVRIDAPRQRIAFEGWRGMNGS